MLAHQAPNESHNVASRPKNFNFTQYTSKANNDRNICKIQTKKTWDLKHYGSMVSKHSFKFSYLRLLQREKSLTQVQFPPTPKESSSFLLGELPIICCRAHNYSIPGPITM